jgi:hypothetical protein
LMFSIDGWEWEIGFRHGPAQGHGIGFSSVRHGCG